MKYNEAADNYLNQLYSSVGATTPIQKLHLLSYILYGDLNIGTFSHDIPDEGKLGCLEYELLGNKGLINLVMV